MAEFLWVESASTTLDEAPSVDRVKFGDGYEEVALSGLNPIRQRWQMSFSRVDDVEAEAMIAFFRARASSVAGLETFIWVPLWATAPIKVKCPSCQRRRTETWGESDITAVFEQVFEP